MSGQQNPFRRWSLFNQSPAPPPPLSQPYPHPAYPSVAGHGQGHILPPQGHSQDPAQASGPAFQRPQSDFFYLLPPQVQQVQGHHLQSPVHSPVHQSQPPSYTTPQFPNRPVHPAFNAFLGNVPGHVPYNPAVVAAAPTGIQMRFQPQMHPGNSAPHLHQPPPLPPRPVSFHYQPPPQQPAYPVPPPPPQQPQQPTYSVPPPPYAQDSLDAQVDTKPPLQYQPPPAPPPDSLPVAQPQLQPQPIEMPTSAPTPKPEEPAAAEPPGGCEEPLAAPDAVRNSTPSRASPNDHSAPEVVSAFDPHGTAADAPIPVSSEPAPATDDKPRMYASFNNYRDDFAYWSTDDQTGVVEPTKPDAPEPSHTAVPSSTPHAPAPPPAPKENTASTTETQSSGATAATPSPATDSQTANNSAFYGYHEPHNYVKTTRKTALSPEKPAPDESPPAAAQPTTANNDAYYGYHTPHNYVNTARKTTMDSSEPSFASEVSTPTSPSVQRPPPPRQPSARKPVGSRPTASSGPAPAPPAPGPAAVDDSLSKRLASMNFSDWTDDDPPYAPMPTIQSSGPGNAVSYECTSERYLDYTTTFHFLPATPGFLICTYCFHKHLAQTPLASHFTSGLINQGRCLFNVRHVTAVLLPPAIASGSLAALTAHMKTRAPVPACAGPEGIGPGNGMSWHMLTNEASGSSQVLQALLVCEACYSDSIAGSPFAGNFRPQPDSVKHESGTTWVCDLSLRYVGRSLHKAMTAHNWSIFTKAVETRVPLGTCPGQVPATTPTRWMTVAPPLAVPGMRGCEACVLDAVGDTPFASHFIPAQGPAPTGPTTCALKLNLPVSAALSTAVTQRNFNIFVTAARIACGPAPGPCVNAGKRSSRWYSPVHGGAAAAEMDVCEACYTGILAPLGMSLHFRANTRPANVDILCDLNLFGATGRPYLMRLMQALDMGTMTPFTQALTTRQLAPADGGCPRNEMAKDREWFGWARAFPDVAVCTACWDAVAARSPLAQSADVRRRAVPAGTICSLYSPRMRSLFAQACAEGSIDSWLAFATQRVAVWLRVWQRNEEMKMKLTMMQIQQNQAMTAGIASSFYGAFAGIAEMNQGPNHLRYGNSSVGWHDSYQRFESAKLHKDMLNHSSNVNSIFASMVGQGSDEQWDELWKAVE
ncbi:hypothetical protein BROUX41_002602 [Berkeleyomyces rouxiae]